MNIYSGWAFLFKTENKRLSESCTFWSYSSSRVVHLHECKWRTCWKELYFLKISFMSNSCALVLYVFPYTITKEKQIVAWHFYFCSCISTLLQERSSFFEWAQGIKNRTFCTYTQSQTLGKFARPPSWKNNKKRNNRIGLLSEEKRR